MTQIPVETPSGAQARVDAHVGEADPHPSYLTQAEADARYPASVHAHPYDPVGTAAGAVVAHEAAADPHSGYVQPVDLAPAATSGLYADLDGLPDLSLKADLVAGRVPAGQLPSYVDDVLEFANLAGFPGSGESGKVYTALDSGRIYRWSGSAYVEISPSPGSTDSVPEGAANLYHTAGRASAAAPVQSVNNRVGAVTGLAEASALAEYQPLDGDLAAIAGLNPADGLLLRRVAGAWTAAGIVKADVGLGNVNNTADADKPVSTAQAAADSSSANRAFPGRKIAALGDSITAGVIGQTTPNINNVLQGSYLMYACMQSGGRLEWDGTYGVPGETTQQVLARVNQVIAGAPDVCVVLSGPNDPNLAAYTTYMPQIIDALLAAGIEPVIGSRPPSSAVYSTNLGVHRTLRAINGWAERHAIDRRLRFVDFFADLVDPVTGLYKAGHNSDVTHPNQTGYRVMGKTLADAMSGQVKAGRSWIVVDPLDETAYTTNPLFLTDNGAGVPTGWSVAAAGTGVTTSFVTDPNFVGRALLTECTNSSTRAIQLVIGVADWNFQPGDRVSVSCKITTSGLEASGATATVSVPNNNKSSGPTNLVSWQVGADVVGGVIHFEDIIPPGTNGASIQIRNDGGNGSAFSYKIGQFSVRSINRLMGS